MPRCSLEITRLPLSFGYGTITLFGWPSQTIHLPIDNAMLCSIPHPKVVWALPVSLAATTGIDFSFSSSPYLDVSVQEVPNLHLWIQYRSTGVCPARFPHSEICGSYGYLLLTAAYRSLSRLSSALSAKASTLRPSLLYLSEFCNSQSKSNDRFKSDS